MNPNTQLEKTYLRKRIANQIDEYENSRERELRLREQQKLHIKQSIRNQLIFTNKKLIQSDAKIVSPVKNTIETTKPIQAKPEPNLNFHSITDNFSLMDKAQIQQRQQQNPRSQPINKKLQNLFPSEQFRTVKMMKKQESPPKKRYDTPIVKLNEQQFVPSSAQDLEIQRKIKQTEQRIRNRMTSYNNFVESPHKTIAIDQRIERLMKQYQRLDQEFEEIKSISKQKKPSRAIKYSPTKKLQQKFQKAVLNNNKRISPLKNPSPMKQNKFSERQLLQRTPPKKTPLKQQVVQFHPKHNRSEQSQNYRSPLKKSPQKQDRFDSPTKVNNKKIIMSAIARICLVGQKHNRERAIIQTLLEEAKETYFILLFKNHSKNNIRAIYALIGNVCKLVYGEKSPKLITPEEVLHYFTMDSASRQFKILQNCKSFTLRVHAITIK